jgi:hypothetical protein
VQRLIANLLMYWMLLLVPGATALELAQPQVLLPACCRVHGAHHCILGIAQRNTTPAWRGEGCPYANLMHAAILLAPYLPAAHPAFAHTVQTVETPSAEQAALSAFLAGLPASRAPPSLS